jgi:hypothetical protein
MQESWTDDTEPKIAEYILSTFVASALADSYPGRIRVENKLVRLISSCLLRIEPPIKDNERLSKERVDVAVLSRKGQIGADFLIELKRSHHFSAIKSDIIRTAQMVLRCNRGADLSVKDRSAQEFKTRQRSRAGLRPIGICAFPIKAKANPKFTERLDWGYYDGLKLRVDDLKKKVGALTKDYPDLDFSVHYLLSGFDPDGPLEGDDFDEWQSWKGSHKMFSGAVIVQSKVHAVPLPVAPAIPIGRTPSRQKKP